MTPGTTKTPGQITSGREFRETETDSSGNYPRVAGQRKSLTSDDVYCFVALALKILTSWHAQRSAPRLGARSSLITSMKST
jgi:hypothetical protein